MSRDVLKGLIFGLLAIVMVLSLAIMRLTRTVTLEPNPPADGNAATPPRDVGAEDQNTGDGIKLLLKMLGSGSASERTAAATILGIMPDAEDCPQVLVALKKASRDEDVDVRTEAALALVRLVVGEDHGPVLLRMLSEDKWSAKILYRHLACLAEDQPAYAVHLLPALNSELPDLRLEVRETVSGLSPEAADIFWKVAIDGEDQGQQFAAMYAMVLMDDSALPTLARALDGPDRRTAARILEDIAGDKAQRTAEEWKVWVTDRLRDPEDVPSTMDRPWLMAQLRTPDAFFDEACLPREILCIEVAWEYNKTQIGASGSCGGF